MRVNESEWVHIPDENTRENVKSMLKELDILGLTLPAPQKEKKVKWYDRDDNNMAKTFLRIFTPLFILVPLVLVIMVVLASIFHADVYENLAILFGFSLLPVAVGFFVSLGLYKEW